ncbi:MAG: FAD-dependent oxidoreductase [Deltaproteobacteria bacterium]|nr:FAD-dependent oxidoreductase [Deltaproteobacteria bacterium]
MSSKATGSVLVVGAGIAGIQASLDLADSGYLVYLVESKSAIGGTMSQLDKTFPTNDCSMCIISPKLVECGRHLNIDLKTMANVKEISGEPGDFNVKIQLNPRYVDLDKCTACGECDKVCPIDTNDTFDEGLRDRKAAFKLYPQAMPSGFAIEKRGKAPCKHTCPAGVSAQGFIALINKGEYANAVKLFKEAHPFPGVCGRVCNNPCEEACTRTQVDDPLAIRSLHRFIADWEKKSGERHIPEIKGSKDERVAIIGAGPAGLTCAYFLAIEGYNVTIFEKLPVVGGMLSVGIPAYRLPRDIIEDEVAVIKELGVEIKTGVALGKDITIDGLRKDGFKSIFIGIGAHENKTLGIAGEDSPGVFSGVEFLRRVNLGKKVELGNNVAVVGGGNVAIDAVRTALRNGSKNPFIIYRRTEAEMPAAQEEIDECREEGIEIHTLTNPVRVISEGGKVTAIECLKMELGEPDESGRRRPVPIDGSEFTIEIDSFVPAIGQETDWDCIDGNEKLKLSKWGTMEVDPVTLQTDEPDIFCGGDAVTGPAMVIDAIAAGQEAAISIDRLIRGVDLKEGREVEKEIATDVPLTGLENLSRVQMPHASPESRGKNYDEVQLGFSEDIAREESSRCLECGICSECNRCVDVCLANAVVHEMVPTEETLNVGAVILAPGFKPFDPSVYDTYSYTKHPNVLTSLEFERVLSASGPYSGHMVRPSDDKEPEKIAWIQCVGSRDTNKADHSYCSAVCCMYTNKQTVIAKEHSDKDLEAVVFFMDMRTPGKEFDKYHERAKNENDVRFVRSRVHSVLPKDENTLAIRYASESGKIEEEYFDIVVLAVGLSPNEEVKELADTMGIELNDHQFAQTDALNPVTTTKDGIYVCGSFQGPKDIPLSVMEASAAATAATMSLAESRNTLTREPVIPPERDVAGEEPRIGVFVCNCGINIGGIADVPAVTEYAKSLPNVVFADENLFSCSQDTQNAMKDIITEHNLNRVVVASCSPRTHEPLFQETIRDAGLNKYLFEMANIRDQNTWVHMNEPDRATEKAKDLVRMAVAKVYEVEALYQVPLEIKPSILVIGGGVAGMESALSAAKQGNAVHLVERSEELGGVANKLNATWTGEAVKPYLANLKENVENSKDIEIYLNSSIKRTSGIIGNFRSELNSGSDIIIDHGATIIATGGNEYKPTEYLYGKNERVLTHLDFDQAVAADSDLIRNTKTTVFIQCVGSRNDDRPYCSKVCCTHSIKGAIKLKDQNPDNMVFILNRDIRSDGFKEDLYKEAREKGVIFVRYDLEKLPEVTEENGQISVVIEDHILGRPIEIRPDLLVLAASIVPNENKDLYELFKVPTNAEGFLVEAHAKLRPVDFASDGIYMAGIAHYPKPLEETIAQAKASVARAMTLIAQGSISVGGAVATVESDLCAVCLTCVRTCPYNAPVIGNEGYAIIEPAECHGCGACVSECPGKAITLNHFTDRQLIRKTDALFTKTG